MPTQSELAGELLANNADVLYPSASQAVVLLHRRGELLHIISQTLIEFRSVATRPAAMNGLGLSPADVESKAASFESDFPTPARDPGHLPGLEEPRGGPGNHRQAGA